MKKTKTITNPAEWKTLLENNFGVSVDIKSCLYRTGKEIHFGYMYYENKSRMYKHVAVYLEMDTFERGFNEWVEENEEGLLSGLSIK